MPGTQKPCLTHRHTQNAAVKGEDMPRPKVPPTRIFHPQSTALILMARWVERCVKVLASSPVGLFANQNEVVIWIEHECRELRKRAAIIDNDIRDRL